LPELPVILVVEDEDLVQALVEDALREAGLELEVVASAEEAIGLLKDNHNYRALVTDINLAGGLDGWEVAKHAREIDPGFAVV